MSVSHGVEGDCLVIGDKTALPPRCVKTNQPVGQGEYSAWNLPVISGVGMVFLILTPILLIAYSSAARNRCRFKAGLSHVHRYRLKLTKLFGAILILASLILPLAAFTTDDINFVTGAILLFPLLFWGGFGTMILLSPPLRVVKVEDEKYWIKGCSKEFLESLSASQQDATDSAK